MVGVPPATVRGLLWGVLLRGVLLLLLPLPPAVVVMAVVVVFLPLSRYVSAYALPLLVKVIEQMVVSKVVDLVESLSWLF